MTVEKVKEVLKKHIGDTVTINYDLGRNKSESYDVKIKELYQHIFLVELKSSSEIIKSFSYSDVITKTIRIDFNECS